jgi:hypothetical protein
LPSTKELLRTTSAILQNLLIDDDEGFDQWLGWNRPVLEFDVSILFGANLLYDTTNNTHPTWYRNSPFFVISDSSSRVFSIRKQKDFLYAGPSKRPIEGQKVRQQFTLPNGSEGHLLGKAVHWFPVPTDMDMKVDKQTSTNPSMLHGHPC